MTFTYGSDANNPVDVIRTLIMDTEDSGSIRLSDEQITLFVSLSGGDIYEGAAMAAEAIAARYAASVDKRVGSLSLSVSQLSGNYLSLAASLREQGIRMGSTGAYAGGISRADKETNDEDTDRVPLAFTKDQFEVPSLNISRGGRSIDLGWP